LTIYKNIFQEVFETELTPTTKDIIELI
jgi:hypothetical protein